MNWVAVFIGGGLGSLSRYGISMLFKNVGWPLAIGTFASNILSCLLLGIFVGWLHKSFPQGAVWQLLLLVGFCGGFSTFSTFSYETVILLKSGDWLWALTNVAVSLIAGIGIIWWLLAKS